MDAAAVLARYDAQARADPPAAPGVERTWADGVLRTTGAYRFIGWWEFGEARAAAIVAREAAFFRGLGGEVEWKVYSHDGPAGLETQLAAAGFVGEESETFLVLDIEGADIAAEPPPGIDIRQVTDAAGFADFAAANTLAFGQRDDWPAAALEARLADPTLEFYVAYAGGAPVCSGRLEMTPGGAFAGLWGGGTAPDHRGRGIYRALVGARAREARRRGFRYLTVDARETSRPILERLGFTPLATVRGWVLKA